MARSKRWLEGVLGFLYPPVCQLCHLEPADADHGYVGEGCLGQIRRIRSPFCRKCGLPYETGGQEPFECSNCAGLHLVFDWARAAVIAGGVVLEVVHRFKYGRQPWFGRLLGRLLVEAAGPELCLQRPDCIVPVPLDPVKEREREFNQAHVLARALGVATGIPVHPGLLRRVRPTETQTHLTRFARARNVSGAFACPHPRTLGGARVVLVDDVLTTGATTSECARALREAGVERVGVWTAARGL